MRYEKIDGNTHIYVENGEKEQEVLRAIVKTSFELARPAGLDWRHFNDAQEMTDEAADSFVDLSDQYGVVQMDYVQGRQCKTYIHRVGKGHFRLKNRIFERDRGLPEPMLDKAKEILFGKKTVGLASTGHMYKGEGLTLRLKEYGYDRKRGESDWDFRKRVFPDLYQKDPSRALEFLMGDSAAEWGETEVFFCSCLTLTTKGQPSRYDLVKFADGFADDPIKMREKRQAAPFN